MSYTNKTQATKISPQDYLDKNFEGNERIQKEALALVDFYTKVTGSPCIMWNKIFGFGKYYYKDSKGGEHEYLITGFATSKTGFTLYSLLGWEKYKKEIEKLGTYKLSGKSCLAIKSIEDIDLEVLETATKKYLADMRNNYKTEN